jgi:hypothetical protein
MPQGELQGLEPLLRHRKEQIRAEAARLVGSWKMEGLARTVLALAAESASPAVQAAAFEGLRELGGTEVIQGLISLAGPEKDRNTRQMAALTAASLDLSKAMPRVLEVLSDLEEEAAALAAWRALLANRGAAAALSKALTPGSLPAPVAKAGMRVAREGGRNEPALILALAQSGNLEEEARDLTPAEIQEMVSRITRQGDPRRGEIIYRRADLACVTCHAIGGVGGKVGPDMTSIGASAPPDYLFESLLYPNRKVKEGYHSLMDIQNRSVGGSLMPSGLIDSLTTGEQIDLLRFLSELGKPGPFDASKGNVARYWKLLPAIIDIAQFGDEKVLYGDLGGRAEWIPAFSFVDGRLSKDALQSSLEAQASRHPSALYAAVQFEVPKAGNVQLRLSEARCFGAWIDSNPVSPAGVISAELSSGTHTFVIKLDPARLPDFVRLETADATFLTN